MKFFLDFEKEEHWLNEMALSGYELIGKSVGYRFQKVNPQDMNIKMDYRTFKKQSDFEDYKALFEDSGWQHISGTKRSGLQYFKKVKETASDDIFSDGVSKASRYKRLSEMYITLAFLYVPLFIALITSGSIDVSSFLNPKLLYYTPGLWEETGASFWRAFLFETPFAVMRALTWWLFPVTIVLFLIVALKAKWKYSQTIK
jgi:hypothetical protein